MQRGAAGWKAALTLSEKATLSLHPGWRKRGQGPGAAQPERNAAGRALHAFAKAELAPALTREIEAELEAEIEAELTAGGAAAANGGGKKRQRPAQRLAALLTMLDDEASARALQVSQ